MQTMFFKLSYSSEISETYLKLNKKLFKVNYIE